MSSLFRQPGEATSSDGSHVTSENPLEDERSKAEGLRSKLQEDTKTLSLPAGSSSRLVVAFPNLTEKQRMSVFNVSLIEEQCRATAIQRLNAPRDPKDYLSTDHPEVKSLTASLFAPFAKDWSDKEGLPLDLIGENAAEFREDLTTTFKDYLNKAATKQLGKIHGLESSSSPKAISASLIGFKGAYQGSSLLPNAGVSSAPSFMSGANRIPFQVESVYDSEYYEISTLGRGGYGQVFRARSHLDKQEYAIKKIVITSQRIKRYMEADQVDALLAEVHTLAKLHHPNIVRYFHAWVEYKPQNVRSSSAAPAEEQLSGHRMLPEPETQETATGFGTTDESGVGERRVGSGCEGQRGNPRNAEQLAFQEIYDDNVVFGFSSAHHSQDVHVDLDRVRRASHNTTTSNLTLQTSVHSVAEEEDNDPEIEIIPRVVEDIGVSMSKADLSAMQVAMEQPILSEQIGQDITLFIKMSLHPMTLSTFLSVEPPEESDITVVRHCFHKDSSAAILAAILDGVDYLHSQGIIHRDIKPANIFLSVHKENPPALTGCVNITGCSECAHPYKSQRVYITPCIGDFGLIAEYKDSKPLKRSESGLEIPAFERSRLSTVQQKPVGTMFYRPISMPKEEPVICPRLDVYSLGVITLELIYKFGTKSERATVLSKLKDGILPSELDHHVMVEGIKAMVCEERDKRWDCGTVRKWLEGMQGKGKGAI